MAGDTCYCRNCRRDIAAANYVIHSVHCERNIKLCTICNEPVPRTEIEQHLEDSHSIDACELCNVGVEKWLMEKHKSTCYKRPVSCEFCELDFPLDVLDEHKDTCGTRTEKCSICKAYVKLKDKDEHREACQLEFQANLLYKCEYCEKSVPANIFRKHVSVCGSQTEKCPKCGDFVLLRDKNTHECKDWNIACEYCNSSIPTDLFCEHISDCGSQFKNCLKCNVLIMQKDRKTHNCQSPPRNVGKCSICQETVPWIDLREHESACRLVTYPSSDDEEDKPKFSAIPMHQKRQANNRQSDLRSQKRMPEISNIRKMNQCPYCGERYPDLIMKDHLERCVEGPFTCELCFKTMLQKDKLSHETRDCKMIHGKNEEYSGSENSYSAVASGFTRSYEKKLKQCSYCNKKFPEIMFQDHLALCEERPYQCSLCLKMMPTKNKINHDIKECTYMDKVRSNFSGSVGTNSRDSPVYKKTFEKGYLENNSQICPYCHSRIPEAWLAEHVQCCSEGKTMCRFCGAQIPKEQETSHLQTCIGARHVVEEPEFQTAGGKKGKKRNKKGRQNEPVEQKSSWIPSIFQRKSSSPAKDFTPTYFQPEMDQLPCEFCEELFPGSLLIEHQSGCRPDLVSFPNQQNASNSDDCRSGPEKDPKNYRDAKSTGALPKRNRFHQNDPEVTPGEFLFHQNPTKEPQDRDYFHYVHGVPTQSDVDVIKQVKTPFPAKEETHDNKANYESEEKKVYTKNSATPIFNFSSSLRKNTSHQSKSTVSLYSNGNPRKGYSDVENTELKAVGAERAERKGIIRIDRDTQIHLADQSDESPDKCDTHYQVSRTSQNSDNKYEKNDLYSPKLQYSEGRFNIPFADETSNIVESEKLKSSCATRLFEQLDKSDVGTNNLEPWDITEDDAKNEETFGSNFDPRKGNSLSREDENLSDSGEHFYDAEDSLKISNIESGDASPFMDSNLDVFLRYLMKDESSNPNENSPNPGNTLNCRCENKICYCGIINQTAAAENNNHLQAEGFEGHLRNENIPAASMKLNACSDAKSANNLRCEETCVLQSGSPVNNAEVENPSKWNKWRSNEMYHSDSD